MVMRGRSKILSCFLNNYSLCVIKYMNFLKSIFFHKFKELDY